ncbi:MAG: hypothetical protein AAGE92_16335, partial [Cyanobacteria bacterium P01_G01_bin.4]
AGCVGYRLKLCLPPASQHSRPSVPSVPNEGKPPSAQTLRQGPPLADAENDDRDICLAACRTE